MSHNSMTISGSPCLRCGVFAMSGCSHQCASSPAWTNGHKCPLCQGWIINGMPHICGAVVTTQQPPGTAWTCGTCGQYATGFHVCPGYRAIPYAPPVTAAPAPEPETRPEPPLAALVADLRDLLGKAQKWLESKRL